MSQEEESSFEAGPMMPSDAREERTKLSIWAEEVDAANFAAMAAAAVFRCSSSVRGGLSLKGPCWMYLTGVDCFPFPVLDGASVM